jgi:hypothetical protein
VGLPPSPHSASISCVVLSTSAPTGASDQLYFVWDSSKRKSTGSRHRLTYTRYYNLVCVRRRSTMGLPPAPRSVSISCVALSTSASTGASDHLYFGEDSSTGKSNVSRHHPS